MYIQQVFEETRTDVMHEMIRQHAFGLLVVSHAGKVEVNHLPFHLDTAGSELGVLSVHVSKGNKVWEYIAHSDQVVAVFTGPDAYITPGWLPNRRVNGRVQPSWAYSAVHAYCSAEVLQTRSDMYQHLEAITAFNESSMTTPWSLTEAPEAFVENLLAHTVGIRLVIERMMGKWQMMQQRTPKDRAAIVDGLRGLGRESTTEVADTIEQLMEKGRE